jgi:hypothetical protein
MHNMNTQMIRPIHITDKGAADIGKRQTLKKVENISTSRDDQMWKQEF